MYNSHVRVLFKSQQAALMKLHAVTAIGTDANHSPDDERDLKGKSQMQFQTYDNTSV